ncbi:hypothetical protein MPSEU_000220300 [Mayamaea pseudoterrestris]|nr:hypothetical protein MPSEU_000220300 [Mayamaea pseudoterrestris]
MMIREFDLVAATHLFLVNIRLGLHTLASFSVVVRHCVTRRKNEHRRKNDTRYSSLFLHGNNHLSLIALIVFCIARASSKTLAHCPIWPVEVRGVHQTPKQALNLWHFVAPPA